MMDADARLRILWRALLAATLLAVPAVEIAASTIGADGPWAALNGNLFTHFACAGTFAIYWMDEADATRRYRAAIIGLIVIFATSLAAVSDLAITPILRSPLVAIGIVGLGFMAHGAVALPEPARGRWRVSLVPALFLPSAVAMAPFFLQLSTQVNPVLDLYILAFEDTLGLRLSAAAFQLIIALPIVSQAAIVCYLALPFGIAAVCALRRPEKMEADIVLAFAIATILGFGIYFIFPAVGPPLFGHTYPESLPPIGTVMPTGVDAGAEWPRNSMLSLHTVWALLIWFNVRHFGNVPRRLLRGFSIANIIATMGPAGGHWLTDLMVAVPFAVGVQALCITIRSMHDNTRWGAVISGFAIAFAWLAALRWCTGIFVAVPGLSWLAIVATLTASIMLERGVRTAPAAIPMGAQTRPT